MLMQEQQEMRQYFFDIWHKHKQQQKLEPLEEQILALMIEHTDYHDIFDNPEKYRDYDFGDRLDNNPFFHLGLHLSLLEQVQTDRPAGIRQIYQKIVIKFSGDEHQAQHQMLDVLAESLQNAYQQQNFDEQVYLATLKRLC